MLKQWVKIRLVPIKTGEQAWKFPICDLQFFPVSAMYFFHVLYLTIRYIASRKTNFNVSLSGTFMEGNPGEGLRFEETKQVRCRERRNCHGSRWVKERAGDAVFHHLDPWSDSPSSQRRCPGKSAKLYPKCSLLLLHRHFFSLECSG